MANRLRRAGTFLCGVEAVSAHEHGSLLPDLFLKENGNMSTSASYGLVELEKEKGFGGVGETVDRSIPQVDMSDFFSRKAEITEDL